MKLKYRISLLCFSLIVFSCTEKITDISSEKKSTIDSISGKMDERLKQHQFSEPQSGETTQKIASIKEECLNLSYKTDWSDIQEKNVWLSEGIGKVMYYFEGDLPRKISVYTESEKGLSKESIFFIKNQKLMMLKETTEQNYESSHNLNIGNRVNTEDRSSNLGLIGLTVAVTTYFDNNKIIYRSTDPIEKENKNVLNLDLESQRILKEFKLLMNEF